MTVDDVELAVIVGGAALMAFVAWYFFGRKSAAGPADETEGEAEMASCQTVLTVTGMTCANCVRHVTRALEELEGVTGVRVDLEPGRATVEHDPGVADADRLIRAVRDAGYDAQKGTVPI